MKLIKGDDLNQTQKTEVLRAFLYRWTFDNPRRGAAYGPCSKCDINMPDVDAVSAKGHNHPTIPLQSDTEWIHDHAFWFLNDRRHLSYTRQHAEPAYMADEDKQ